MGSSEFEWGALPKSLESIRRNFKDYRISIETIGGKFITVFCTDEQRKYLKEYLECLADNKWYLKEYSDFNTYINPDNYFRQKTDFWWDIENDLMFWKRNTKFTKKFINLIANKPA